MLRASGTGFAGMVFGIMVGALVAMSLRGGATPSSSAILRAHRLELLDDSGKVRAVLGTQGSASLISLVGDNGQPCFILSQSGSNSVIMTLLAKGGKPSATITCRDGEDASLSLIDARGRERKIAP